VPWIARPRPVLLPEERGAERWQLHGDFDATQFFLDRKTIRKPSENRYLTNKHGGFSLKKMGIDYGDYGISLQHEI